MDVAFIQLSQQSSPDAVFQQCDEPNQVFRSCLPPTASSLSAEHKQRSTAFGKVLVKCLVEGIRVPLNSVSCNALGAGAS